MSDLFYSDDALNILDCFYDVDKVVYVEGDDDVVFWQIIFEKTSSLKVEIKSTGGLEELKKYIEKIERNEIDSIAARDSDFSLLLEDPSNHKNVINTYAHSIENTIVCSKTLTKIIKTNARLSSRQISIDDCETWLEFFYDSFKPLIIPDAINDLEGAGLSVMSDNCTKFMRSQTSPHPDESRISKYLEDNDFYGSLTIDPNVLILRIDERSRKTSDFIRGHFLFSGAIKYVNERIKHHGSKKSTSKDGFFSSIMLAFESVFNDDHPHYEHYIQQTSKIVQTSF